MEVFGEVLMYFWEVLGRFWGCLEGRFRKVFLVFFRFYFLVFGGRFCGG